MKSAFQVLVARGQDLCHVMVVSAVTLLYARECASSFELACIEVDRREMDVRVCILFA